VERWDTVKFLSAFRKPTQVSATVLTGAWAEKLKLVGTDGLDPPNVVGFDILMEPGDAIEPALVENGLGALENLAPPWPPSVVCPDVDEPKDKPDGFPPNEGLFAAPALNVTPLPLLKLDVLLDGAAPPPNIGAPVFAPPKVGALVVLEAPNAVAVPALGNAGLLEPKDGAAPAVEVEKDAGGAAAFPLGWPNDNVPEAEGAPAPKVGLLPVVDGKAELPPNCKAPEAEVVGCAATNEGTVDDPNVAPEVELNDEDLGAPNGRPAVGTSNFAEPKVGCALVDWAGLRAGFIAPKDGGANVAGEATELLFAGNMGLRLDSEFSEGNFGAVAWTEPEPVPRGAPNLGATVGSGAFCGKDEEALDRLWLNDWPDPVLLVDAASDAPDCLVMVAPNGTPPARTGAEPLGIAVGAFMPARPPKRGTDPLVDAGASAGFGAPPNFGKVDAATGSVSWVGGVMLASWEVGAVESTASVSGCFEGAVASEDRDEGVVMPSMFKVGNAGLDEGAAELRVVEPARWVFNAGKANFGGSVVELEALGKLDDSVLADVAGPSIVLDWASVVGLDWSSSLEFEEDLSSEAVKGTLMPMLPSAIPDGWVDWPAGACKTPTVNEEADAEDA
jgi:hypothetical protein